MSITVVTAPTFEPIGLEQARDQVRSDKDLADEAAELSNMIATARIQVENFTRRALLTQTLDVFRDSFPGLNGVVEIPRPPTQSVTSVKYLDEAGTEQTLSASLYVVDVASQPARIIPADGETWPITQVMVNAVTVRVVAGYGDGVADIPAPIIAAMLLAITDLYDQRGSIIVGVTAIEVPQTVKTLLYHYRTYIPESWS